jgi:hypothetical protein
MQSSSPRFDTLLQPAFLLMAPLLMVLSACGGGSDTPDAARRTDAFAGLDAPGFFPDAFVELDASAGEDAGDDDAGSPAQDAAMLLADTGPQSDAGGGASCGGRGSPPCPAGTYCNFPPSSMCGRTDGPGTCERIPLRCPIGGDAVCGCDGTTYDNACLAARASVSVETTGPCPTRCDPDLVRCDRLPPRCIGGQVPSVVAGCWGPCVPIEACTCTTFADCPDIRGVSETCYRRGVCGPLL